MKYKLNELNIDAVSKEVDPYLSRRKTENKDRVKTRLAVEEALLNYMSAFGSEAEFTVDYSRVHQHHSLRGGPARAGRHDGQLHHSLHPAFAAGFRPGGHTVSGFHIGLCDDSRRYFPAPMCACDHIGEH